MRQQLLQQGKLFIKNLIIAISSIAIVIAAGLLFLVISAHADSFLDDGAVDLQEVKVGFIKMLDGTDDEIRSLNIPGDALTSRLNLNVNTNLMVYGFWNNEIHSATDNSQFREVGYKTNLGIRLTDYLDVSFYHHSQHVLDSVSSFGYETEDGVQIDIYLFSKERKNKGIF